MSKLLLKFNPLFLSSQLIQDTKLLRKYDNSISDLYKLFYAHIIQNLSTTHKNYSEVLLFIKDKYIIAMIFLYNSQPFYKKRMLYLKLWLNKFHNYPDIQVDILFICFDNIVSDYIINNFNNFKIRENSFNKIIDTIIESNNASDCIIGSTTCFEKFDTLHQKSIYYNNSELQDFCSINMERNKLFNSNNLKINFPINNTEFVPNLLEFLNIRILKKIAHYSYNKHNLFTPVYNGYITIDLKNKEQFLKITKDYFLKFKILAMFHYNSLQPLTPGASEQTLSLIQQFYSTNGTFPAPTISYITYCLKSIDFNEAFLITYAKKA